MLVGSPETQANRASSKAPAGRPVRRIRRQSDHLIFARVLCGLASGRRARRPRLLDDAPLHQGHDMPKAPKNLAASVRARLYKLAREPLSAA